MKHDSITTPGMAHDEFNIVTELIFLNRFGNVGKHPWRMPEYRGFWSSTLAIVRKLNKVHGLSCDQLAFYVFRCEPKELSADEFAKAAVVAKKLFRKFSLEELVRLYRDKYIIDPGNGLSEAAYKSPTATDIKPTNLFELLKELENAEAQGS